MLAAFLEGLPLALPTSLFGKGFIWINLVVQGIPALFMVCTKFKERKLLRKNASTIIQVETEGILTQGLYGYDPPQLSVCVLYKTKYSRENCCKNKTKWGTCILL